MVTQELEWHHGQLLPVPASCQNETKSVDEVMLENEHLRAENQRLREALERIQDHKEDRDDWWIEQVSDHVEMALKQEGDNDE